MKKEIGSIQVLRALAALMIVLAHAQDDAFYTAEKVGVAFAKSHALPWVAGVDLFFVISGFIMVHASQRLFATRGAAWAFISRRLIRIVPLYWLFTALMLAVLGLLALRGGAAVPSAAEIATSLGFVPFARGDGQPRPIAAQGWTLNYEMAFYVVFALFIGFRRNVAVAGVALSLVGAVALGALLRPTQTALTYWSDPIVLEFVLGMGVAVVWHRGLRLPGWLALGLVAAGLGMLALDFDRMADVVNFAVDPNGFGRLAACGVPMALVFAAVVLAAPGVPTEGRALAGLAFLGDASYALYLFHPVVVVAARKIYLALGLAEPLGFWPLVLLDIPLTVAFAVAVHVVIEKRITAWLLARFRARSSRRTPAAMKQPASIYWR